MLIIRLTRRGRRNDPSFRLVVTERSNPIKGKFLEELGSLNPKTKAKSFEKERILHWLAKGVKCSPTVNNLLVNEGILQGPKVKAWRPKVKEGNKETAVKEEAPKSEAAPQEKLKEEEKTEESPKETEVGETEAGA